MKLLVDSEPKHEVREEAIENIEKTKINRGLLE